MEWIKFFDLIAIVLWLFCLYQFYRLVKEFKKLNPLQKVPDEFARKRYKRLILICILSTLVTIFWTVTVFLM